MTAALPFTWTGDEFRPLPRFRKTCDATFVVDKVYTLEVLEERSAASHKAYFASINDVWQNLREDAADRFRSAEHLRKYALIRTGFADSTSIVASSKAEAQRVAAFIRPIDEFSVVTVEGCTVTRWVAKSQSQKAMGKPDFEASKRAVLDFIADMIGVSPAQIEHEREGVA